MIEKETHVWIVEDNTFLRDTIVELIDAWPGMRCTLAAGSCEEALARLEEGDVPHVVLMDLGLPGMSGLEGIGRVKAVSPTSHVVVLTVHEDDDRVFEALCAGACGYLLKPATSQKIVGAIETALEGGAPMNAFIARKVLTMFTQYARPKADYGLTEREREILHLLLQEQTQKEIFSSGIVIRHRRPRLSVAAHDVLPVC